MIAILSFLLLAQMPASAAVVAGIGLRFDEAQEAFAREAVPSSVPPEPCRSLLLRMGRPAWRDRDEASREALAYFRANPSESRWLFWGRAHADPEIRLRSNAALRRLNPCPSCGGDGRSRSWDSWPCADCEGSGTAWPYSMWD